MGGAVVVGGGLAALEVGLAMRRYDAGMPVTVISSERAVTYRPRLIRVPAGGPQPPLIPFARLLAAGGVSVVAGRVKNADLQDRRLILESGAQVEYDHLVVASGAVADRGRVPGAADHALFPCDLTDAGQFAERVLSGSPKVAVVFGWERPGPGMEYAAWIAAFRPGVQVTAIDGDDTLERRFGSQATARLKRLLEKRGARLITGNTVESVSRGTVNLAGGAVDADVIALAAPLRGTTEWLPRELVDDRGRLRVDNTMLAAARVSGIGDVVAVPEGYRLPPTLYSIRATARGVARNVVGGLRGAAPLPVLKPGQPDMMGPDLAGTALLVRERRLILSGRLPLLLGSLTHRRYLRSRNAQITGFGGPNDAKAPSTTRGEP